MAESEKEFILTPKKKNRKDAKVTDAEIADAITRTRGIIAKAAALLSKGKSDKSGYQISITRSAISQRINKKEALREIHDEAAETMIDRTEDKLFQAIEDGNVTAIIFYLKCKGKHRGYIERQSLEVSGPGGRAINVNQQSKADLTKLTDEEFENLVAISAKARGESAPTAV
jgi:hypothetical protein